MQLWADRMLRGSLATSQSSRKRSAEQQVDLYLAENSSAPSSLVYWQVGNVVMHSNDNLFTVLN